MSGLLAGATLASGLIGSAISYSGSKKSAAAQRDLFNRNVANQKEFAQNGIQWKVQDAKKAGIHPLAALGANTMSYTPISVGDTSSGSGLQNMGQDVSRAIYASANKAQRQSSELQLENQSLQNELLKTEIVSAQRRLSQTGPAMPEVKVNPSERTASPSMSHLHQQSGDIPYTGFAKTPTGLTPVPSSDVKNRIEDQLLPELKWGVDNYFRPMFSNQNKPPRKALPKGFKDWEYQVGSQEWRPVKHKGRTPWNRTKKWFKKKIKSMTNQGGW